MQIIEQSTRIRDNGITDKSNPLTVLSLAYRDDTTTIKEGKMKAQYLYSETMAIRRRDILDFAKLGKLHVKTICLARLLSYGVYDVV